MHFVGVITDLKAPSEKVFYGLNVYLDSGLPGLSFLRVELSTANYLGCYAKNVGPRWERC